MTKALEKAFTMASTGLHHKDQDRLGWFIIDNFPKLHEILDDLLDEQNFDRNAIKAIESENVQHLLRKVAEKHGAQQAQ